MRKRTCCFTGHRNIPAYKTAEIKSRLKSVIRNLISEGIIYFGAGGALGFDTIAALTVLELKEEYPQIKLILVLPCENQTFGWSVDDVVTYNDIKARADKCVYTSKNYYNGCMQKRNRHLVDNSSICVCYLTQNSGGTFYTVNYARNNGLKIYNIASEAE
ncbi:MAG: DUF1273 family protein [Firmicutes bacterium]|nr:DUF1273 family protein [Bacillota bacterium]